MCILCTITDIKFLPFQHITHNMYIKDYTKHTHIDINNSCDVQQETILVVVHVNLQILIGIDRDILVSLWIMNAVLHPNQCRVIVTFHIE